MRRALAAALLVALPLAGCMEGGDAPVPAAAGGAATPDNPAPAGAVLPPVNFTTPWTAGAPVVRTLEGRIAPELSPGTFGGCCSMLWLPADDLFQALGPAQMRLTVSWTNTPTDSARLGAAACVPYHCGQAGSMGGGDGAQTVVADMITGKFAWWEGDYRVGVLWIADRITSGIPFTIQAEVVPLERGLSADTFRLEVPEGGKVFSEILAPVGPSEVSVTMFLSDGAGRLVRMHPVEGAHGSRAEIPIEPGVTYLSVASFGGGTISLSATGFAEAPELAPLERKFEIVDVATVADPRPVSGTHDLVGGPGFLSAWPMFALSEGAQAGLPTSPARGTLTSSSGVVWHSTRSFLGARVMGEQFCVSCNGGFDLEFANFVDDDGRYVFDWEVNGGMTGQLRLFVIRFTPV